MVDVEVSVSNGLRARLRAGKMDIALVTGASGSGAPAEAEELIRVQLVWATCAGGVSALQEPLPVSVWVEGCAWRNAGLSVLDKAGRRWRVALQSAHISGQRAAVLADLAVAPIPAAALGGKVVEARPELGLPPLPSYSLCMFVAPQAAAFVRAAADHLRAGFTSYGS